MWDSHVDRFDDEEEPDPALNVITNAIIGAAIAVHRQLGPGLPEGIYQRSLELEFAARGIVADAQKRCQVYYRDESVGLLVLDFMVQELVIVEVKSVDAFAPVHTAELISYLRITGARVGLLLNFNVKMLKDGIKRVVL